MKAKVETQKSVKIKVNCGKISLVQLTREEFIDIPIDIISITWKRENISHSRFMGEVFEDYTDFVYEGSILNGYLEGNGKLFYSESDVKEVEEITNNHVETRSGKSGYSNLRTPVKPVAGKSVGGKDAMDNLNKSMYNTATLLVPTPGGSPNKSPDPAGRYRNSGPRKPPRFGEIMKPEPMLETPSPKNSNFEKNGKDFTPVNITKTAPTKDTRFKDENLSAREDIPKIKSFNAIGSPERSPANSQRSEMKSQEAPEESEAEAGDQRSLFFEGNFTKGLIDGPVKLFQCGGDESTPLFTGTMQDGLLTGFGVYNYPSGKKFLQGVWLNDKPNGKRNFGFYETGFRYFEGEWGREGGLAVTIFDRNGKSIQYKGTTHPFRYLTYKLDWCVGTSLDRGTGRPRCIGTWINGKLHGENIEIYENTGMLMSVGNYDNGNLKWSREYNKEGKLKLEAYWQNARWQGAIKRYGPSEELIWEGTYENGVREGFGIEYWDLTLSNGVSLVKKVEGTFHKAKMHGDGIKLYSQQGVLRYEGTFIDDKKEGMGTQYHINGAFELRGYFKTNQLTDNFVRVFSNEGVPVYQGKYSNGYRKGFGKVFDFRGKLRMIGNFDCSHNPDRKKAFFRVDQVGKLVEQMGTEVL